MLKKPFSLEVAWKLAGRRQHTQEQSCIENRKWIERKGLEHTTFGMNSKDECNGDSPLEKALQDKNQRQESHSHNIFWWLT